MIKKILLCTSLLFIHTSYSSQSIPEQNNLNEKLKNAIKFNNINAIIELIKETNIDINITSGTGASALSTLCTDAYMTEEWFKKLIEAGYSSNKKTTDVENEIEQMKQSCLRNAKKINTTQYLQTLNAIHFLLEKGANPNLVLWYKDNQQSECTLPFLFRHTNNQFQKEEYALNINIQDNAGNTPLHKAIYAYNADQKYPLEKTIISLIELGADTTIKNKKNKKPSDIAQHDTIKNILTQKSVRKAQMPFYKQHLSKHNQHKTGNLFSLIQQRERGKHKRLGM